MSSPFQRKTTMSLPVPLGNKPATLPSPVLIRVGRGASRLGTSASRNIASSRSILRDRVTEVSDQHVRRRSRGARLHDKENQPLAQAVEAKLSPSAPKQVSPSECPVKAPEPIATYIVSTDISDFLQALRANPDALLIQAAPGRYSLFPKGAAVRDSASYGVAAEVRLLIDLRMQMKAGVSPFKNRNLDGWEEDWAWIHIRDVDHAVKLRPDLGLTFLAKAIGHCMESPRVQQASINRILWCLEGHGRPPQA